MAEIKLHINYKLLTMKKLSLLTIFTLAVFFAVAQDLDEIQKYAFLNQGQKGKEAVDKFLAVEKNAKKPEGWFYKGFLYNLVSKDSSKTIPESIALKQEAFNAFKKYRELDPKTPLLTEQNNGPLFDLYMGYSTDIGVKAYNAKDQNNAFEGFTKALDVHDYIYANNITGANGFKFAALDTTLTTYAAIAAHEAKRKDDAAAYYKKLADANVSDPQYLDVYQVLADHYRTKKDQAAFNEILAKGRKLYPNNEEYWTALEIENATAGVGKPAIFAKYDELLAAHPNNYMLSYNYGVELYQYIFSDSVKPAEASGYKTKLVEVMKSAVAAKPTLEANFLLANFLYNNSIDIADEGRKIKGVKPDDVKKKKEITAASNKSMEDAIPYAQGVETAFAALTKPKTSEKVNYKQALVILKNIYEVKKDTAKVAEYDKKIKAAES
jgi:hypothetical protein